MISAADNTTPTNGPPDTGWFWLDNGIVERISQIGGTALAVYVVLTRFANGDRVCFPSIHTISSLIGKKARAVQLALRRLESAGLIRIETTPRANRYTRVPLPPDGTGASDCTGALDCTRTPAELCAPGAHQIAPLRAQGFAQEQDPKNKKRKPAKPAIDPALLELIDGWNGLGPRIVKAGNGAKKDPPGKAVLAGWKRALAEPEQRRSLENIPRLIEAIKRAKFCHAQGWFSLAWLFGKNRNAEFNITKLLTGAHDGNGSNGSFASRDNSLGAPAGTPGKGRL